MKMKKSKPLPIQGVKSKGGKPATRVCLICLRQCNKSDFESWREMEENKNDGIIDISDVASKDSKKLVSSLSRGNGRIKPETVNLNFLKIISRFVGIKTKNIRTLAEKHQLPPPFCKDCFQIVQNFCDVYEKWEIAGMTLHWKFKQIADGIRKANSKVSGKLVMTLYKILSTQMRLRSANLVQIFRNNFLLKCSAKAKKAVGLQISLNKNTCQNYLHSKLKYPIEEITGYLKSLIIVFALAAAPKTVPDKNVGETSIALVGEISNSKVKLEPQTLERNSHQIEEEDHYEAENSPPVSPAGSPLGVDTDVQRNSDADWSDGEVSVRPSLRRKRNLRKRRNPDNSTKGNIDEVDEHLSLKTISNRVIKEKKFPCNICSLRFVSDSFLKSHISRMHPFISAYDCKQCSQRFKKKSQLNKHQSEMHSLIPDTFQGISKKKWKKGSYICLHCERQFTFKESLDIHVKRFHKFTCDVDGCTDEFENTEDLRNHLKDVHLPPGTVEIIAKVERGGIFNIKPKTNIEKDLNSSGLESMETENASNRDQSDDISSNKNDTDCTASENPAACVSVSKPSPATTRLQDKTSSDSETGNSGETSTLTMENKSVEDDANSNQATTDDGSRHAYPPQNTKNQKQQLDNMVNENTGDNEIKYCTNSPLGLYTCEKCRWSFTNTLKLSLHLISHTKPDKKGMFNCNLCTMSFLSCTRLQIHYNSKHGPKIKLISCDHCEIRFYTKEKYRFHLKTSHKDKLCGSYLCTECGDVYDTSGGLKLHTRQKHTNPKKPRQILHCDECGTTFKGVDKLVFHQVKVHGKEKTFKCEIDGCNKVYATKGRLNEHKEVHGEPKYLCPHCPKAYNRNKYLKEHLKSHSEKTIICDICGKSFYTQKFLTVHMETHTDERKFLCSICGKGFKRPFLRDQHEKIHSSERSYKCKYCGEGFKQSSSRNLHQKIHEKNGGHVRQRKRRNINEEPMEEEECSEPDQSNYFSQHPQNQPSTSSAAASSTFVNTFLLSNPYLLKPETSTTSQNPTHFLMQQQIALSNQQGHHPQSQGSLGGTHPINTQYQEQHHQRSNLFPHDLSKSNPATFFANPR